jgi:hypothetical protein
MEADAVFTWDGQFCHRAWVLYVSEATTLSTALTTIQDSYGSEGSFRQTAALPLPRLPRFGIRNSS